MDAIDDGLREHWAEPNPRLWWRRFHRATPGPSIELRAQGGSAGGACPFRAAVFALFALAVTWPVLATAGSMNIFRDAQVLYAYERDAAWSVLHFGSLPLWDPYYCGGLYALGTPQSRFASPTFLLSLLFGPARGEALTIFAMVVLGLEGTFRYLRIRGGGPLGALLAAPVFAMSGVFIASPFLGWTNFFGFELVPWVLLFLRRALRGETAAAPWAALCSGLDRRFWRNLCRADGGAPRPLRARRSAPGSAARRARATARHWPLRLRRRLHGRARRRASRAARRDAPVGAPGYRREARNALLDALGVLVQPVAVKDGNLASKHMFVVGAGALVLAVVGLCRRRTWPLVPLGVAAF